jgi:hypothetical protein
MALEKLLIARLCVFLSLVCLFAPAVLFWK